MTFEGIKGGNSNLELCEEGPIREASCSEGMESFQSAVIGANLSEILGVHLRLLQSVYTRFR